MSTVSSGSVSINDDSSVQVLAEEAHPLDRLDSSVSQLPFSLLDPMAMIYLLKKKC